MPTKAKRYLLKVLTFSVLILAFMAGAVYYVDPFFQFRVKDNQYMLNPWLINPGLARNGDYNTIIIGSSMVQNYNMSLLRKREGVNPVKLASGAMNVQEMEIMYNLTDKKKVDTYIINFDLPQFNQDRLEIKYPKHLYQEGIMNKLKYFFSYESGVRYTPTDFALSLYLKNAKNVPEGLRHRTNIDNIGSFSHESVYGKEHVKQLYLSGQTVSIPNLWKVTERMKGNLDQIVETLDFDKHKDIDYIIVYPPYSALYWNITQSQNYYKNFIEFLHYSTQKLEKYDNVRVVYFCDIDQICNLDNYTDVTHFNQEISDMIVNNLYNPDFELNSSNVDRHTQRLDSLITAFNKDNEDWLSK